MLTPRSALSLLSLFSTMLLFSCSSNVATPLATTSSPTTPSKWIVAWGAASQNAVQSAKNPGGSEQSFRFLVYPTVGGTQERVHFSNHFGSGPITIGAARLAVASDADASAAIDPTKDAALTFNGGSKTVTLQPQQEIDSDPVQISYTFGQWLAVSMYLQGTFPALTEHDASFSTNFYSPVNAGDVTTDAVGKSFTTTDSDWLLVTSVQVYGPYQGTVAVFGSSSMDGINSNLGNTNSYPIANVAVPGQLTDRPSDYLARSLNQAGYSLGVANASMIGDPAGEDKMTQTGSAAAGVDRFNHDVVQLPGIAAVVIYIGGIDVRVDCLPATTVEGTLTNIVALAAAANIRVILATLPPSEYCTTQQPLPSAAAPFNGDINPGPENTGSTQRRALNDWIRSTGAHLPGVAAIADFDQVLAYPAHPDFMIPNLNSGDNFHPNGVGYGIQNSAIPLRSLLGQ